MLSIKDKGLLLLIIDYCSRINEKINTSSKEDFMDNRDLQEIICFNIFQIGELAKSFSTNFIAEYDKISWKSVKGMRDKIGHGYSSIDLEIVYETAKKDIIALQEYCKKIIEIK